MHCGRYAVLLLNQPLWATSLSCLQVQLQSVGPCMWVASSCQLLLAGPKPTADITWTFCAGVQGSCQILLEGPGDAARFWAGLS